MCGRCFLVSEPDCPNSGLTDWGYDRLPPAFWRQGLDSQDGWPGGRLDSTYSMPAELVESFEIDHNNTQERARDKQRERPRPLEIEVRKKDSKFPLCPS